MQIKEAINLTTRALDLLDEAGLGTSATACHLQMALDSMPAATDLSIEELLLATA